MAMPATTGQLRESIADMEIGDYIPFHLGASLPYKIGQVGSECPTNGHPTSMEGLYWYMIKVDRGLLISDRVTRNMISWSSLNASGLIEGGEPNGTQVIDGYYGCVRSLSGGVSHANAEGRSNITPKSPSLGAFPLNNEWDRYIVNFPEELIQEGKTLDDVFHWSECYTMCMDTPIIGLTPPNEEGSVADASSRTWRMNFRDTDLRGVGFAPSNMIVHTLGFRPVFEYKE